MTALEEPTGKRPPLWPSLLIAVVPAIYLPLNWILRHHNAPLDFTILLAPVYIALAFGVIWPVLVGLQAIALPSARRPRLWRYRVAVVLFLVSAGCSVPVVIREIYGTPAERAENARMAQWHKQLADQESAARQAIAAKGMLAFREPLQGAEPGVLVRYIYDHALTPEELQRMSEQYQEPMVMNELGAEEKLPAGGVGNTFRESHE